MKLGLKFSLSLVVPLVALVAAFGYTYQQRSQALLREELAKEGRAIALVVQTAAEDYLRDRQPADLRKLVDQVTGYERVLGLRIFGPEGRLVYQSSTLEGYPFQNVALLRQVLRDRKPGEMRRRVGDESVLGFVFPLVGRDGSLEGAGQVLQLESYIAADARSSRRFILGLTLTMVLATVTIVFLVTRLNVTLPIEELVRSFRRAGGASLPAPVPVRGEDELGRLATEFNGMCERLARAHESLDAEQRKRQQAESRLRNAQRLASLGRLAAGLAHEIGTPLNVISGRADALERHVADNDRALRALREISAQSDRIVRIVRDMLDFARMKSPRRAPTSVRAVVTDVLQLAADEFGSRGFEARVEIPPDFPFLTVDADRLQQVFHNLILNARDAMEGGGVVVIRAREVVRPHPERVEPPAPHAVITFEDTGVGIRPEHVEHVFDPFFTTKEPGRGTGLGLAVAYGIVEEHGGWLEIQSEPGRGTCMAVYLPIGEDPADVAIQGGKVSG